MQFAKALPFLAFCNASRPSLSVATEGSMTGTWLLGCAASAAAAHLFLAAGTALSVPHPMVVVAGIAIVAGAPALPPRRATRSDWACFILALLACMLPFRSAAAVALIAAGGIAWRDRGISGQATATLLFALAGWALKDGVWAGLASTPVLATETELVAFLLRLGGLQADAEGNFLELSEGHGFVILRTCSILSLAYPCSVATFAISRLLRPQVQVGAKRILATLAMLAVCNTGRLTAMAASPEIYDYLHGPSGEAPLQALWASIILLAALPARRQA